ncbi:MAG TPA: hypothetical protein DEQ84_06020 [Prevotellaceae bacterium]|nr:hypothetical protein [Prevotellaceae bacterium]
MNTYKKAKRYFMIAISLFVIRVCKYASEHGKNIQLFIYSACFFDKRRRMRNFANKKTDSCRSAYQRCNYTR